MKERELLENLNSELQTNSSIKPPTFAERLREFAVDSLREFRGVSLRLNTYVLSFATLATVLNTHGVSEEDTFKITVPAMMATILAGELYFMDRFAKRFPWLECHTLKNITQYHTSHNITHRRCDIDK